MTASALEGCIEEASEPNDTVATAAPYTFGTTQSGAICTNNANNPDYYVFQGPPSGTVFSIRLEFLSKISNLDIVLFDAHNNFVTSASALGDNNVLTATSNGGLYTLEVAGPPNTYRIVSAQGNLPRCAEPDPDEPNDFFGQFTALTFGTPYNAFDCAGEADFYQFQGPPAGQEFTVNLAFDNEIGDLDFDLSSNTQFISARSRNDNETASLISTGGVYTLHVGGPNLSFQGSSSNSYQIQTLLGYHPLSSCPEEDAFEPNDRPNLATPLQLSSAVSAFICGNLPDYYTLQGPAAGTPFFARVRFAGPVAATVELINQLGTTVATGDTNVATGDTASAVELTGTVSDGGTYTLLVRAASDAVAQAYDVSFTTPAEPGECAGVDDAFEPNDSSFRATSIPFPGTLSAASCDGNVDQYRFQGPPAHASFQAEVVFSELSGTVDVRLIDDAGSEIRQVVTKPGVASIERVSNGGRYRLVLDPRTGGANHYTVNLRDATRLCSVTAEISSLGEACGTANGGPFVDTLATLSEATAPALQEGVSQNVTLVETPLGNQGLLSFTPTESGSYALFTGTPGARTELRSPDGVVDPQCLSSLDIHQCNKLRRVYRYDLTAGVRYVLAIGPAFPQKFVRLGLEKTIVSALECTNQQLLDRAVVCARDLADAAVSAAAFATPGPAIVENSLTLVQLPNGPNGHAGSVNFTPPLAGTYELYVSLGIPLEFADGTASIGVTCQRDMPVTECAGFRRAATINLDNRHTYRLDLGPTTASSARLLLKRVEPATPKLCGATELPSKTVACAIPATQSLPDIEAVSLDSLEPAPAIQDGVASYVHLTTAPEGNSGAVSFQPTIGGSYQVFLGAAFVPFRFFDGLLPLPATCTQQLTSTDCQAFRRGTRYELQAGKTYRLEFGPITPSNRIRVLLDSSNH